MDLKPCYLEESLKKLSVGLQQSLLLLFCLVNLTN